MNQPSFSGGTAKPPLSAAQPSIKAVKRRSLRKERLFIVEAVENR
jgi:hypothetical protein